MKDIRLIGIPTAIRLWFKIYRYHFEINKRNSCHNDYLRGTWYNNRGNVDGYMKIPPMSGAEDNIER